MKPNRVPATSPCGNYKAVASQAVRLSYGLSDCLSCCQLEMEMDYDKRVDRRVMTNWQPQACTPVDCVYGKILLFKTRHHSYIIQ